MLMTVSPQLKANSDNVVLMDLGWHFDYEHAHGNLPNLKWVSADNQTKISREIVDFVDEHCWDACSRIHGSGDQELLSRIHGFDFRYIGPRYKFVLFVNWLYEQVKFVSVLISSHD